MRDVERRGAVLGLLPGDVDRALVVCADRDTVHEEARSGPGGARHVGVDPLAGGGSVGRGGQDAEVAAARGSLRISSLASSSAPRTAAYVCGFRSRKFAVVDSIVNVVDPPMSSSLLSTVWTFASLISRW